MPKGFPPTVFVSSTCYDLGQLRADLKDFLSGFGFETLLSETPGFPVNPQASTIENCVNAVKERADILVLVIGARYGSTNASGKSITNLEYLAAKAKGIPIYVFVSKPVVHGLPIWKKNPTANFEDIVDTPQLFSFVEQLRGSQEHWVYAFEYAKEITEILREQLAFLFMDALTHRERLKGAHLPEYLSGLTGTCLKLVFEKPPAWEYYLFGNVLSEGLADLRNVKRDLTYGLKIGRTNQIGDAQEVFRWISAKGHAVRVLLYSMEKLMNVAIQEAFGPPGTPGDPEHIVYVARRMTEIYKSVLEWTIDFNLVETPREFQIVLKLFSKFSDGLITEIESMPGRITGEADNAVAAKQRGDSYIGSLHFRINAPDTTELTAEFERLQREYAG